MRECPFPPITKEERIAALEKIKSIISEIEQAVVPTVQVVLPPFVDSSRGQGRRVRKGQVKGSMADIGLKYSRKVMVIDDSGFNDDVKKILAYLRSTPGISLQYPFAQAYMQTNDIKISLVYAHSLLKDNN